jgi:hypothetical protein
VQDENVIKIIRNKKIGLIFFMNSVLVVSNVVFLNKQIKNPKFRYKIGIWDFFIGI